MCGDLGLKSQCPRSLVPVPVLYTTFLSLVLSSPVTFTDIFICKGLGNTRDLCVQVKSFRHCFQFMTGFSDSQTGQCNETKFLTTPRLSTKDRDPLVSTEVHCMNHFRRFYIHSSLVTRSINGRYNISNLWFVVDALIIIPTKKWNCLFFK